jgi:hypothetical protein
MPYKAVIACFVYNLRAAMKISSSSHVYGVY